MNAVSMLLLGLAMSSDAFAAALRKGAGMLMAGRALGALVGKRAELLGGLILIAVGATILYDHLHAAAVSLRS